MLIARIQDKIDNGDWCGSDEDLHHYTDYRRKGNELIEKIQAAVK